MAAHGNNCIHSDAEPEEGGAIKNKAIWFIRNKVKS
jgi:hypothetical protein